MQSMLVTKGDFSARRPKAAPAQKTTKAVLTPLPSVTEHHACARRSVNEAEKSEPGGTCAPAHEKMKLLEKLPAAETSKFFHKVIDGLYGHVSPQYRDYDTVWNLTEWMEVLEQTALYFRTAVGKDLSEEEAVQPLAELNPDTQRAALTCLKARKPDIRQALIGKTNAICSSHLLNFDWQLKLALSSDKLSMLQMPLLNLDLDLSKDGDLQFISVEMNKEELQALINALEAANKAVLQLK
ncbi:COMM domain-containing protein 8 [Erythrolamprus reginae]|uniref:COMM domain-containing protein 8 n=1 Tax=Erythrolamprus reginae TaxID=121349 RepID=UPI00396CA4CA